MKMILIFLITSLYSLGIISLAPYFTTTIQFSASQLVEMNVFRMISSIVLLPLFEEILFRYHLTKNDFIAGVVTYAMLVFCSFAFVTVPIKGYYSASEVLLALLGLCGLILWNFSDKWKQNVVYNFFFTANTFKTALSVFLFAMVHITNYSLNPSNIFITGIFVLLLHIPISIFFAWVRMTKSHGFLKAFGFHALNNALVFILKFL
jgi:hypothetical protein